MRFTLAMLIFVGALQFMKAGAAGLDVSERDGELVENAASTLGLGWIGSLVVLSGSPIAASSLTLVEGGSISEIQGFAMLTGSRLGAAFVVWIVAVIYTFRAGDGHRAKPLSAAVIALATTAVAYVPAGPARPGDSAMGDISLSRGECSI